MFWVALIVTYMIIAVVLIVVRAGVSVIRRQRATNPTGD